MLIATTPGWRILDCSLRDGGYQNNWAFPLALAQAHLALLDALGITMAEIGFRSPSNRSSEFRGQFGHSGPALLRNLKAHAPNVQLGVMVNESEFAGPSELAERFKGDLADGALSFVRVATQPTGFRRALELAEPLIDLGLPTFVNLMQIDRVSKEDLVATVGKVSTLALSGIYIADSLGALRPPDAAAIVELLTSLTDVPIGVHFHDNFGLAFANSIAAIGAGVSLVDGTALGIGRGAGNTSLEFLLLDHHTTPPVQEIASLVELWKGYIQDSDDVTRWGPSLEYALAARSKVHPTFVQKMLERETYSAIERVTVIEELGRKSASRFSENALEMDGDWFTSPGTTSPEIRELFKAKNLLLVGSGPSVEQYMPEIRRTADELDLTVWIIGPGMPEIEAAYRIISHPASILSRPEALQSGATNVGPFSQLASKIPTNLSGLGYLSIDLALSTTDFGFNGDRVSAGSARSSIVALALLAGLSPDSIFVAGFDGFPSGDRRNHEFSEALRRLQESGKVLFSLTPTAFEIEFYGFS